MTMESGIEGTLVIVTWPAYIGACDANLGMPPFTLSEPIDDPVYERGQIFWTPVNDDRQVIGRGRIILPPGRYTHYIYFQHPRKQELTGIAKMPYDVIFTQPRNILDVDPIINTDLNLNDINSAP
jgi:hypothetical protein